MMPVDLRKVVDERLAACQECQKRASNQRTMLAVGVVAAVATVSAAALTAWTQHTADRADARASARMEARLSDVQRQLNRQSQALEDLRDEWRSDRRDLELRIAARPMSRNPDRVTR
jgi:sirohydrochlorin ferrochelatase